MSSPTWRRCVFVVSLLLLTSFSRYSRGQETATIADEAAAAAADSDIEYDATESVIDLDAATVAAVTAAADETACGVVDDVDENTPGDEVAATAAIDGETSSESAAVDDERTAEGGDETTSTDSESTKGSQAISPVVQSGPFVDLLGDLLISLEMIDETKAQVHQHHTNVALDGKKVVGLYFSADWCGPCRQFTPDLVNFYNKMNARMGKKDEFEIVWISRCRTIDAFGQYFTQMNWLALPPTEAMGQRGQYLGEKFKVKSIPTLVLLDEIGNVITYDARNKIPLDKAGIGFPWKSPVSVLISTLVPRTFRLMVKGRLDGVMGMMRRVLLGKATDLKEALARRGRR
ncbi:hypothetical protein ACHAW5_005489 [Stephanodiscus triporus]|uniref:Thioredoxin domain-containing protein n=1 Tax=Stephanodiscus triporus TaxID=2934178 RepID=A0ABD3MLZ7_9STRA